MSWIEAEIGARGGSVSFRDFMELALYHPDHGYYSSDQPRFGRTGDFLTAPSASAWYGRIIAGWIHRLARRTGPVICVDAASGDGAFIAGLDLELARLGAGAVGSMFSVERSAAMRRLQRDRFRSAGKSVTVVGRLDQLPVSSGPAVVHASELYDAIPVHRVVMRDDGLRELMVESTAGGLGWVEQPADDDLRGYFDGHGVVLDCGQYAEVNPGVEGLHGELLHRAGENGLAVVLDYGYPSSRLYDPRGRRGGTLVAYRGHVLEPDLLRDPGSQDLTAHVNWDDLRRAGRSRGWREIGLWQLAEFLIRAGLEDAMSRGGLGPEADLNAATVIERQEIKRLLDPDGMGSDLKVLVQGRGEMASVAEDELSLPAAWD